MLNTHFEMLFMNLNFFRVNLTFPHSWKKNLNQREQINSRQDSKTGSNAYILTKV